MKIYIVFIFLSFIVVTASSQKMDNKKLEKILNNTFDSIQGKEGYWQFKYFDRYFLLITDEKHNRMRIVSPIVEEEKLDEEYYKKCLEANYHTVLDVKYVLSDGLLWSVFIHPLKELSEKQVKDAIVQVYSAAATFGRSYTSTELVFGKSN
ncbi:MAG: hypothetical protein COA97_03425 [Flavobacteriales bacterium]|nr:MAG: hypothetical protein COA97_03425 [Flavobacteriales bacterium]